MTADPNPEGVQTGSSVFRPRAHIIRTLGRDLIQNEVVALQELIKNSYDADATRVTLTFKGSMAPGMFVGPMTCQFVQIGNAVPPPVAETLAMTIRETLGLV